MTREQRILAVLEAVQNIVDAETEHASHHMSPFSLPEAEEKRYEELKLEAWEVLKELLNRVVI
jgi:hypothetical protein